MSNNSALFCHSTKANALDNVIICQANFEPFESFELFIKSNFVNKVFVIPEVDLIQYNEERYKQHRDNQPKTSIIEHFNYLNQYSEGIKNNNVELVIDIGTGGLSSEYFIDLFDLIKHFAFDPKKITIIVNTKVEYDILQDMISEHQLPLTVLAMHRNEIILADDFFSYKRSKRFLFLCRRWTPERFFIFLDLHKRKILDNCLYSFTFELNPYTDNKPNQSIEELFSDFVYHFKNDSNKEYVESIEEYWNVNKKEITENGPNWFGKHLRLQHDSEVSSKFYDTHMSLCVETNITHHSPYFQPSEKIYKSCFFRHPFLVYSTHDFLKSWNKSGYKSFENIFNESYDNEANVINRIRMINDEVENINNLTNYIFMNKMYECQKIVNHNQNLLTEKFEGPTKKNLVLNNKPILEDIIQKEFRVNQYIYGE
jgi:hypothetical protein